MQENTSIQKLDSNSLTKSDVYNVYWIHLESHTDVKKQGYVGITKQSVDDRFYKHCWDAEKSKLHYPVSRAIRKYSDKIRVKTLCVCHEDYAKDLEFKLRPTPRIGWNIVEGGQSGNSEFMKEKWKEPAFRDSVLTSASKNYTDEFRKAASERFTKMHEAPNSKVNSDEYIKDRSLRVLSWLDDPEIMKKKSESISKTRKKNFEEYGLWIHPNTNHEVWSNADKVFEEWFKGEGDVGHKTLSRMFGFKIGALGGMVKLFREGWQPHLDKRWLDFYKGASDE